MLTRVGRPTCFVIEALDTDENGQPFYRLSRALAQQMCKADYLDTLQPGDILPCTVTHIDRLARSVMWAAASVPCCPSTACR